MIIIFLSIYYRVTLKAHRSERKTCINGYYGSMVYNVCTFQLYLQAASYRLRHEQYTACNVYREATGQYKVLEGARSWIVCVKNYFTTLRNNFTFKNNGKPEGVQQFNEKGKGLIELLENFDTTVFVHQQN